jgi:2-phosphosulfolactate phosphatase
VGGKKVIFTTTNGTRAMIHAQRADEIFLAAFLNVSAVARRLFDREHVNILCAGTDGKIGQDDVLLAGMLVERLQREGGMVYLQNGQAITARETWLHAFALPIALGAEPLDPDRLAEKLQKSLGGQNLMELGLEEDILAAARIDQFDIVPKLDPTTMRIRAVGGNDE